MSDKEESAVAVAAAEEETTRTAAMAESEETQQQSQQEQEQEQKQSEISKKFEKMSISLSIWPPTQRTRDAVINRLIETLTAPSILSKRYGFLPADEATSTARLIEEEAFTTATAAAASPDTTTGTNAAAAGAIEDDGIEILQIYSKEISKRMLDAVKGKAAAASSADNAPQTPPVAGATGTSEEISSVESGTS